MALENSAVPVVDVAATGVQDVVELAENAAAHLAETHPHKTRQELRPWQEHASAEANWEAWLVKKVAKEHAKEIPGRTPEEIADLLFSRMLEKKKFRIRQNLNHWPNYAPEYLTRLVRWLAHKRKKEIETFIQKNPIGAYTLALAITENSLRADWVVSETNLEVWDGRLREELYFLGIKRNARNLMQKLAYKEEHFLPLEGGFVQEEADENEPLAADESYAEPGSTMGQESDPLGTLIKAEEKTELEAQIAQAKIIASTDRKYWWIRQKKWAKALGIGVNPARKVSTKRPARRIR
jgi:hypothetical protein